MFPTFQHFSAAVDDRFDVRIGDAIVPLTLTEAASASDEHHQSFSLLFRGVSADALTQQTYRFFHPVLGEFDIFIVPVAHDGDRVVYQAVFN